MNEYGDGKAGQWAKKEAEKRIDRMLLVAISAATACGLFVGLIFGAAAMPYRWFAAVRQISTLGDITITVSVVAMAYSGSRLLLKLFLPHLDALSKERIRYLHGG